MGLSRGRAGGRFPNCAMCDSTASAFAPDLIGGPCPVTSASQSSWNSRL